LQDSFGKIMRGKMILAKIVNRGDFLGSQSRLRLFRPESQGPSRDQINVKVHGHGADPRALGKDGKTNWQHYLDQTAPAAK
jgi:hypothetical protein